MTGLTFAPDQRRYEWRIVLLLSLTFGLVGLDRWILPPLFPLIMRDLGLDYSHLGLLACGLGLSWGVCAILFGTLSDRFGRRRVLLPAVVAFSLMSMLSGFAGSFGVLLLVRAAMGVAEGAFTPVATAATAEASHPRRRGFNQGVMMSSFALLGFGLAPIVATGLMSWFESWRAVFLLVGLPGLVLAALLWRTLREPDHLSSAAPRADALGWRTVAAAHNVRVATLLTLCAMSCVVVVGTMVPSYLADHLKIGFATTGIIMSAMGFGGFLGEIAVPGVSDIIGRKPASLIAFAGALAATWLFTRIGANPVLLFLGLGLIAFFAIGLLALLTGPVATEAVPPVAMSSAIGLVSGLGEIFGGAGAPVLAGYVAVHAGIAQIFWVPMLGLAIGLMASLLLHETVTGRFPQNDI